MSQTGVLLPVLEPDWTGPVQSGSDPGLGPIPGSGPCSGTTSLPIQFLVVLVQTSVQSVKIQDLSLSGELGRCVPTLVPGLIVSPEALPVVL